MSEASVKKPTLRKIAVLFTDIVGSSRFFQHHGNVAGLDMIKKHHNMVPPIIKEHNGYVVKFLGDSVLAYFNEPEEALKSAIRIQKIFQDYNKDKEPEDQIHIKIAVHYGEGILDNGDIYGDVVNVAAKLLEIVNGDELQISDSVYNHVKNLSPISFESVNVSGDEELLNGIKRYIVKWDENIEIRPSAESIILIKPLWEIAPEEFKKIWRSFKKNLKIIIKNGIKRSKFLNDGSFIMIAEDIDKSILISKKIKEYFNENSSILKEGFLPIYIVIDAGSYPKDGISEIEELKLVMEELEPGEINVSLYFLNKIKDTQGLSFYPDPSSENKRRFYKLITSSKDIEHSKSLFLYQDILRRGDKSPCFYCGAKVHSSSNCPSKHLPPVTKSFEILGYMSFDEINRIFLDFITNIWSNQRKTINANKSSQLALHALFDINRAFQLRTMELVCNTKEEEKWNKAIKRKFSTNRGGLVWLGQDCIRVSNLVKAEALLKKAMEKSPRDFRPICLMGFVSLEKGDPFKAMDFFQNALESAISLPQKIYCLFLLLRIYHIMGDVDGEKKMLKEILRLDPFCIDAIYQDILQKLREDRTTEAETKLRELIDAEKEYFPISLIDPQLAPNKSIIHSILLDILKKTGAEAEKLYKIAGDEISKCENLLLSEDLKELNKLYSKSEKLIKSGTYFALLDAIHYCNIIVEKCHSSIKNMRVSITKILNRIDNRIERSFNTIERFPYPSLVRGIKNRLIVLSNSVRKQWNRLGKNLYHQFRDIHEQSLHFLNDMRSIESDLNKRVFWGRVLKFGIDFIKKSILFELINLILAILVFPVIVHYVMVFFPSLNISLNNFWFYQKALIYIGGIIALILALLISAKNQKDELI